VFLGLPSCTSRFIFSNIHPVIIELATLPPSDARSYLLELATSACLPDLFTVEALDLIIDGSHGSPRLLRSIASLAFFSAACEGASQISHKHVTYALAGQIPSSAREVDESPQLVSRDDEMPAESLRDAHQFPTDLHSSWSDMKLLKSLKHPSGDSKISRGMLLVAIAVVIAASFAIARFMPSMLAGTSPDSTTRPNSVPAPVQTLPARQFGVAKPTPVLPPTVSNEAEKIVKAAPVLNAAENIAQAEKEAADRARAAKESAPRAEEAKTVTRRVLTLEEEAAVARGIQELERASTQLEPQDSRR